MEQCYSIDLCTMFCVELRPFINIFAFNAYKIIVLYALHIRKLDL